MVLVSARGSVDPSVIVRPEGLCLWNVLHAIGILDLPDCSAVPQPTGPPRAPLCRWCAKIHISHDVARNVLSVSVPSRRLIKHACHKVITRWSCDSVTTTCNSSRCWHNKLMFTVHYVTNRQTEMEYVSVYCRRLAI